MDDLKAYKNRLPQQKKTSYIESTELLVVSLLSFGMFVATISDHSTPLIAKEYWFWPLIKDFVGILVAIIHIFFIALVFYLVKSVAVTKSILNKTVKVLTDTFFCGIIAFFICVLIQLGRSLLHNFSTERIMSLEETVYIFHLGILFGPLMSFAKSIATNCGK